jgi:enediyne polyketide synthase
MDEAWPDALLAPYLERSVEELARDGSARIAFERGLREDSSAATDLVIQQALGRPTRIWRRADGRPVLAGVETVSAAHAGDFTLAVGGGGSTSCDIQEIRGRTDREWRDLLGRDRYGLAERTARECHENLDIAATRIWMALECLKKAGKPVKSPLVFESNRDDGWAVLRSGRAAIVTCIAAVRGIRPALGVAVMVRLQTQTERRGADTNLNALRPAN